MIGAGFIGAEVAATCVGRGLAVTMVEAGPVPLGRVLPGAVGFGYEMWLAMHEDLRGTRRVRLVYDHLAEGLSAYLRQG